MARLNALLLVLLSGDRDGGDRVELQEDTKIGVSVAMARAAYFEKHAIT